MKALLVGYFKTVDDEYVRDTTVIGNTTINDVLAWQEGEITKLKDIFNVECINTSYKIILKK